MSAKPAVIDSATAGLTDRLVDAVDTVDAILRERFAAASCGGAGQRGPSNTASSV